MVAERVLPRVVPVLRESPLAQVLGLLQPRPPLHPRRLPEHLSPASRLLPEPEPHQEPLPVLVLVRALALLAP